MPPLMISPEILTFGAKGIALAKENQRDQADARQGIYRRDFLNSSKEVKWEHLFLAIMRKLNPNALLNDGKLDDWRKYFNQNVRTNIVSGNSMKALVYLTSFDTKVLSVLKRIYHLSDEKGNTPFFDYYYGNPSKKLKSWDYNDLFQHPYKINNVNNE